MNDITTTEGAAPRLSPLEKRFLLANPRLVLKISHTAFVAEQMAEGIKGLAEDDDLRQAFLRCYWSALLARDIGPDDARCFFEVHQAEADSPARTRQSRRNSAIGIWLGCWHVGVSNEILAERCASAVAQRRLQTSTRTWRPSEDTARHAFVRQ